MRVGEPQVSDQKWSWGKARKLAGYFFPAAPDSSPQRRRGKYMSRIGRHSAPKNRKLVTRKLPAIAVTASLVFTSAVAFTAHSNSATKPATKSTITKVTAVTKSTTKSAGTKVSAAKAIPNKVASKKVTPKKLSPEKAKARAKVIARINARAKAKASARKYVVARMKVQRRAATRSRTIRKLSGQVASIKAQLKAPGISGRKVIALANNYRGVPYILGGTSPRGFDCSGYTQYVFRKLGVNLPRVADAQYHATTRIPRSKAKSGDLVFFHDRKGYVYHVAIYSGRGKIWQSPRPGRNVGPGRVHGRNVTFGRVSSQKARWALVHQLAAKKAKLAHLRHKK